MSRIIMTLRLPEPKIRKRAVRAVQKHRNKSKYTRKQKHKATSFGGLMLCGECRSRLNWPWPVMRSGT